ncbi:MAG TPA: YceI family protein [Rhizomicrobium sp.]|jgi:polyisoprenoid-binding protein YceI
MRLAALCTLAIVLAAQNASATPWKIEYAKSRLGFTVNWSNEPFSASFRRWNAAIDFDPNDLGHAHAIVTVDLASESSDEPDFDSGLKGAQGFQTSQFPTARFETTHFVRKSANSYVADGTLTIRGISRPVTLPFTLLLAGGTAHMTGTAHVLRTEFGLGQGEWAAPTPVAHDVAITVDLTATQ